MLVLPSHALSRALWTSFSLSESKADVASSRRSSLGLRIRARAIAMHCFCPRLSNAPFSPTLVSYPCNRNHTNWISIVVLWCIWITDDKSLLCSELYYTRGSVMMKSCTLAIFAALIMSLSDSDTS